MTGFAVLDFETTGLGQYDRVVEIGVVLVDEVGGIEGEWTTLLHPQRDVSASHIHGISARDTIHAPTFAEAVDWLGSLLAGRIAVAHNAAFDMRFLAAELGRAGRPIPPALSLNSGTAPRLPSLCTLEWARRMSWPGSLAQCCGALGIPLDGAHCALNDARATAQLLGVLLRAAQQDPHWYEQIAVLDQAWWPRPTVQPIQPRAALRTAPPPPWAWIDEVIAAVPIPAEPADEAEYLVLLQTALLDLHISVSETEQLAAAAARVGLTRSRIGLLHQRYLHAMAVEALADGVVTAQERADLERAALVLGLSSTAVDQALAAVLADAQDRQSAPPEDAASGVSAELPQLAPGDRVVLTGDMRIPREAWVTRLTEAGLTVGGVTKATKLVAAADPDSTSGKAARARGYGIPVVAENGLERIFRHYLNSSPSTSINEEPSL